MVEHLHTNHSHQNSTDPHSIHRLQRPLPFVLAFSTVAVVADQVLTEVLTIFVRMRQQILEYGLTAGQPLYWPVEQPVFWAEQVSAPVRAPADPRPAAHRIEDTEE